MDYTIRRAVKADIPAIAGLSLAASDDSEAAINHYLAMLGKQFEDLHTLILVAEIKDAIVGYAIGELFHDELDGKLYANAVELHVENAYSNTDLPLALATKRETMLKTAGALGICATIEADNASQISSLTEQGYKIESQDINLYKSFN